MDNSSSSEKPNVHLPSPNETSSQDDLQLVSTLPTLKQETKSESRKNGKAADRVMLDVPEDAKVIDSEPVKDGGKDNENSSGVSLLALFRFANRLDKLFIAIGTVGALANGMMGGVYALLYGKMVNDFTHFLQGETTRDEFISSVEEDALLYLVVAVVILIGSYLQSAFWIISSERQGEKMRKAYISSLLKQHIGWFDQNSSSNFTSTISRDTQLIEQAIGDQFGNFVQKLGITASGLVIGFTSSWSLTLVMLALSPALTLSLLFLAKLWPGAQEKNKKVTPEPVRWQRRRSTAFGLFLPFVNRS